MFVEAIDVAAASFCFFSFFSSFSFSFFSFFSFFLSFFSTGGEEGFEDDRSVDMGEIDGPSLLPGCTARPEGGEEE